MTRRPATRSPAVVQNKIPIDTLVDYILYTCLSLFAFGIGICIFFDQVPMNKYNEVSIIEGFLPVDACNRIIEVAEKFGHWETSRHPNYPTTDIPVRTIHLPLTLPSKMTYSTQIALNGGIPLSKKADEVTQEGAEEATVPFSTWIDKYLVTDQIFPLIRYLYPNLVLEGDQLSMQDLFLVKYDADNPNTQRQLAMHIDSSMVSFNLALNDPAPVSDEEPEYVAPQSENVKPATTTETHQEDEFAVTEREAATKREQQQPPRPTLSLEEIAAIKFAAGGTRFRIPNEGSNLVRKRQGSLLLHPSRVHHEGVPITKGQRYILVGFVKVITDKVSVPSYWSYLWYTTVRRFGRLGQCMRMTSYSNYHHEFDEKSSIPIVRDFSEAMVTEFGTVSVEPNQADSRESDKIWQCKSMFNIYGYEIYTLYRDTFFADERRYARNQDSSEEVGLSQAVMRVFKKGSLLFLALALIVCFIAVLMMTYEYLVYLYEIRKAKNGKKGK